MIPPSFRPVIDQLGRPVTVPVAPQRIVSLVPSQTELLFDLGLGARVVGVTKFCIYPPAARQTATVVGGTKNVDLVKVEALQPDLIIGNKEENELVSIAQLAERYPVWLSDIRTLPEALAMIAQVGLLTGMPAAATALVAELTTSFATLAAAPTVPVAAAYFIWRKPYMVAAGGTFIDAMLRQAGFRNVFAHLDRYPDISPAQLAAAAPTHLFLSSEPFPFQTKHFAEFQAMCPAAKIQVVDGELFSWYGSRLRYSAAYFHALRRELGVV